ncbi:hypothetical protein Tco_0288974, partial [Tanacetum coccineum]
MANLTEMLAKFVTANTASTSGSGTLPGVTPPKIRTTQRNGKVWGATSGHKTQV